MLARRHPFATVFLLLAILVAFSTHAAQQMVSLGCCPYNWDSGVYDVTRETIILSSDSRKIVARFDVNTNNFAVISGIVDSGGAVDGPLGTAKWQKAFGTAPILTPSSPNSTIGWLVADATNRCLRLIEPYAPYNVKSVLGNCSTIGPIVWDDNGTSGENALIGVPQGVYFDTVNKDTVIIGMSAYCFHRASPGPTGAYNWSNLTVHRVAGDCTVSKLAIDPSSGLNSTFKDWTEFPLPGLRGTRIVYIIEKYGNVFRMSNYLNEPGKTWITAIGKVELSGGHIDSASFVPPVGSVPAQILINNHQSQNGAQNNTWIVNFTASQMFDDNFTAYPWQLLTCANNTDNIASVQLPNGTVVIVLRAGTLMRLEGDNCSVPARPASAFFGIMPGTKTRSRSSLFTGSSTASFSQTFSNTTEFTNTTSAEMTLSNNSASLSLSHSHNESRSNEITATPSRGSDTRTGASATYETHNDSITPSAGTKSATHELTASAKLTPSKSIVPTPSATSSETHRETETPRPTPTRTFSHIPIVYAVPAESVSSQAARIAGVVSLMGGNPLIAVQQSRMLAIQKLGLCGSGAGYDKPMDVFSHPTQVDISGNPMASQRGAALMNPALTFGFVLLFLICVKIFDLSLSEKEEESSFEFKRTRKKKTWWQRILPSQGALDTARWPSVLFLPMLFIVPGCAEAAAMLWTHGTRFIDRCFAFFVSITNIIGPLLLMYYVLTIANERTGYEFPARLVSVNELQDIAKKKKEEREARLADPLLGIDGSGSGISGVSSGIAGTASGASIESDGSGPQSTKNNDGQQPNFLKQFYRYLVKKSHKWCDASALATNAGDSEVTTAQDESTISANWQKGHFTARMGVLFEDAENKWFNYFDYIVTLAIAFCAGVSGGTMKNTKLSCIAWLTIASLFCLTHVLYLTFWRPILSRLMNGYLAFCSLIQTVAVVISFLQFLAADMDYDNTFSTLEIVQSSLSLFVTIVNVFAFLDFVWGIYVVWKDAKKKKARLAAKRAMRQRGLSAISAANQNVSSSSPHAVVTSSDGQQTHLFDFSHALAAQGGSGDDGIEMIDLSILLQNPDEDLHAAVREHDQQEANLRSPHQQTTINIEDSPSSFNMSPLRNFLNGTGSKESILSRTKSPNIDRDIGDLFKLDISFADDDIQLNVANSIGSGGGIGGSCSLESVESPEERQARILARQEEEIRQAESMAAMHAKRLRELDLQADDAENARNQRALAEDEELMALLELKKMQEKEQQKRRINNNNNNNNNNDDDEDEEEDESDARIRLLRRRKQDEEKRLREQFEKEERDKEYFDQHKFKWTTPYDGDDAAAASSYELDNELNRIRIPDENGDVEYDLTDPEQMKDAVAQSVGSA